VKQRNGIRYGDFEIHGIKGNFPSQAITSTNLNHAKYLAKPDLDFKTSFLEIIEKYPKKLFTNSEYRKQRITKISQIIRQNPNKLSLLVLNGARTLRITKEDNLLLIKFQIECGFKLIKVFFKNVRNASDNVKEFRKTYSCR